jgi:tetratricopeptide (TPR) repeat protein
MARPRVALILAVTVIWTAGLAGQETPSRWESLLQQARSLAAAGDSARAEQVYQSVLSEELSVDESFGLYLVVADLARFYRSQNRLGDLEAVHRRVLASQEAKFGSGNQRIGHWLMQLAEVLVDRGAYTEAEQLSRRAVAHYKAQPGRQITNIRAAQRLLGRVYRAQNRNGEADAMLQRSLEVAAAGVEDAAVQFGQDHPSVASALITLAGAHMEIGQHGQSEQHLRRALDIYESAIKTYPELSMHYASALRRMSELQAVLGRDESSRELRAQADSLLANTLHYERSVSRF